MATTEQRPGFRLPWANDAQSEAGSDTAGDGSETPSPDGPDDSTGTAPDPRDDMWPASDTPRSPGAQGDPTDQPVTHGRPTPRPVNPLVAGLVRAMRDAAEGARQEALAELARQAKARSEQIQAESASENAEIRRAGDHEVAEIREWSKAEMARLREETEQRIAARRRGLELECDDLAARAEHRLEHVREVVGTFETRMEAFFRTLMAEDDPARLAGFAEQMPEPPDLTDERELAGWTPSHTLDPDHAAEAEALALADIDVAEDSADSTLSDAPVGSLGAPGAAALDNQVETATPDDQVDAADATVTRLSVVGLISVASIAGFKRAVAKAAGVESISVTSGPGGEFIFTVLHAPTVNLGEIVGGLDGFSTSITSDEAGVLSVAASQSDDLG